MLTATKRPIRRTQPRRKRTIFDEIAEFMASSPTHEEILEFHPSPSIERRASQLLEQNREGTLSDSDQRELDEFSHAESLMRRLKAQVRGTKRP